MLLLLLYCGWEKFTVVTEHAACIAEGGKGLE